MGEVNATSGYYGPLEPGSLRFALALQFDPLTEAVVGDRVVSPATLNASGTAPRELVPFESLASTLDVRWAPFRWGEVFGDLPYDAKLGRDPPIAGVGDVTLGAHAYPRLTRSLALGATAGLSLPTGHRGTGLVYSPEFDQFGLGVPAVMAGLDASLQLAERWLFSAQAFGTFPLGATNDGYRTAPAGVLDAGPVLALDSPHVAIALLVSAELSGRDLVGDAAAPNTGRLQLAVAPAVTWWMADAWSAVMRLRVPVHTRIDERSPGADVQLAEPVGVVLSLARDVGLGGP